MDNNTVIANRDQPIPVIRLPSEQDSETVTGPASGDQRQRARDRLKEQAQKLKDKLDDYGTPEVRQSLQDRFLSGIMSHIIPSEALSEDEDEDLDKEAAEGEKKNRRSRKQAAARPDFSVTLMSNNFRRFNARCGVLFVLQNRLIHLFTWRHPTVTLSFLAVYSLVCLKPHLLPTVPLAGLLFWIMIPSFLARHPTPVNDPRVEPSFQGPPIAPPTKVKPAPDLSQDFFRNMRDLQNSMEDFSRAHDAANDFIAPYTNFSDEGLSSMLFVVLFGVACVTLVASEVVPWRFISLAGGWTAIVLGHPEAKKVLLSTEFLSQLDQYLVLAQTRLRSLIDSDILLDDPPEVRQVEVFELQKHHFYSDTWEAWLFSPSAYEPLSPARIAGSRAKGTQFFEDVQAPAGWIWKDKKWSLDLESREWVEQRMVTGVEIETEGERWVYDIPVQEAEGLESSARPRKLPKRRSTGGRSVLREVPTSGWEEGKGFEIRGEWRRRRWVRLVERKAERLAG